MEAIKPGTRCECTGAPCAKGQHVSKLTDDGCLNDAVRMVTVRVHPRYFGVDGRTGRYLTDGVTEKHIPMCEPCAAYHEAKAGLGKGKDDGRYRNLD